MLLTYMQTSGVSISFSETQVEVEKLGNKIVICGMLGMKDLFRL